MANRYAEVVALHTQNRSGDSLYYLGDYRHSQLRLLDTIHAGPLARVVEYGGGVFSLGFCRSIQLLHSSQREYSSSQLSAFSATATLT